MKATDFAVAISRTETARFYPSQLCNSHSTGSSSSIELGFPPVPTANPKQLTVTRDRLIIVAMGELFRLIWWAAVGLFRPRSALQAEILVLRHHLNVLRRRSPERAAVINTDRLVFTGLYRLSPDVLDALKILKPETVIRWHRAGFRAWWRGKSRPRGGRGTRCLGLEVSTPQKGSVFARHGYLHQSPKTCVMLHTRQ
jgi:hypothetical protein